MLLNEKMLIRPAAAARGKIYTVIWAYALAAILAFALIMQTYAWFIIEKTVNGSAEFGNFKAELNVWFDTGEEIIPQTADGSALELNLTDTTADNYYRNLRCSVDYSGIGEAYLRVMILEIWNETETVGGDTIESFLRMAVTDYTLGALWLDNRRASENATLATFDFGDMFIYYYNAEALGDGGDPYAISGDGVNKITLDVITFVPAPTVPVENPDITLRVWFLSQAVQRNRYRELWDIESLPTP